MARNTNAVAWVLVAAAGLTPARPAEPDVRRLADLVPDYMQADLETAIIPTPQWAELQDTAFAAGKVLVVRPDGHVGPDTLVAELAGILGAGSVAATTASTFAGGKADAATCVFVGGAERNGAAAAVVKRPGLAEAARRAADRGAEAYVLFSAAGRDGKPNVVLLAGNAPAGDFRALATLRQMAFAKGGTTHIREGIVVDFPRFRFRGNKRPRAWEWRYKANYGWFYPRPGVRADDFRRSHFRGHGAWIRHGSPLTATDEEMDRLIAGYDEARPGRKARRRVPGARQYYDARCREFVLKFDDTGSEMSAATRARFGEDGYFRALHHYLVGMHRRIKALDPANRVFFMPRPYYANSFELADYARALLACGPLPDDIGLSVCGPEVISPRIPTGCLAEFRRLFGLKGKAQIYDNAGRGGEYAPCTGRDKDLWTEAPCLFGERGTCVTRITVCDYLWNPEAYDPDRSLHLAVRELAGGAPEVFAPLLDYVDTYNRNRVPPALAPQEAAADHFRRTNRALQAKYKALVPLLGRSSLAAEVNLADELWGTRSAAGSYEVGEYARLRRRLEFEPYMVRFGWRQGRVARAAAAPTIDGRLDEQAWRAAQPFPPFVQAAWRLQKLPPRPDALAAPKDQATTVRMLYTPTHLYIGAELTYTETPQVPEWARTLWQRLRPGDQADLAWRVPCLELFFDPAGRRTDYYHLIANTAGVWLSKHFGAYEPGNVGRPWRPVFGFAFRLGPRAGAFEAALPFADLPGKPPRGGDAWGFQCFRSNMGTLSIFSGVYDLVGGEHAANQFGRVVFE